MKLNKTQTRLLQDSLKGIAGIESGFRGKESWGKRDYDAMMVLYNMGLIEIVRVSGDSPRDNSHLAQGSNEFSFKATAIARERTSGMKKGFLR